MSHYLRPLYALCAFLIAFSANAAKTDVLINEIMYHAPNDLDALEYIELYNPGEAAVDLSGWTFTNGVSYKFPDRAQIGPAGYFVVCRNLDAFQTAYGKGIAALGNFEGALSNGGEQIELLDETEKKIDSVKYGDSEPWPIAPDGYSSSLERICPSAKSNAPENWAPSPLPPEGRGPTGTPGRRNANYSANLPPVISEVKFSPNHPAPNQPVNVQAKVQDTDGLQGVALLYRVAKSGSEGEETQTPMKRISGTKEAGVYEAVIPGQLEHHLIRFRMKAIDANGASRFHPSENEVRPTYSYFTYANTETAAIPFGFIVHVGEEEYQAAKRARSRPNQGGEWNEEDQQRWMAMEMLRQGMNLEANWLHHIIEQNIDAAQIRQLRQLYRERFDVREKLIEEAGKSKNLKADIKNYPATIQAFNANLLDALKTVLTEEQQAQFALWHKGTMLSAAMGSFQWGPEQFLKRFINIEGICFFQTVTLDLNDSQIAQMKKGYREAHQARRELIEVAKAVDEDDEEKRDELFSKGSELNESLSNQSKSVLTDDQYKRFSQWREENSPFGMNRPGPKPPPPPRGKSAFIYVSPDTKEYWVYDYIHVTPRTGGYKVRFYNDRPLKGRTTINLLFEYVPRFVLAEPLAYEVYRRAGVPAELAEHIRLWIDDDLLGYHLLLEQPNRVFLRRNKRDDTGNLYKILWYEQGVVKGHEKKTNPHTGHDDIVSLVEALNATEGEAQWNLIKRHFNVEEVINYFAVNMCLSNWDGFFNNYFTYHDINGSGKWEMYPWDEDKTWGFHDGLRPGEDFYDMPLTFGMNGDIPPGMKSLPEGGGMGWGRPGMPQWWRPGGYFSGPLLANPHFRKPFLARLKEITETIYTQETFFPIIDEMAKRLEPEVRIRAEASGQGVDAALQAFHDDIQSLRRHLTKRRNFILAQEEIKEAGPFSPAELQRD